MAKNKVTNLFAKGKRTAVLALLVAAPLVSNAKVYTPNDFRTIRTYHPTAEQITSALSDYKENFGYDNDDWETMAGLYFLEICYFISMYSLVKKDCVEKRKKLQKIKKMQISK